MRNILRGLKIGKPIGYATSMELADADDWIDAHYLFVNPQRRPSLEWILDAVDTAESRHGAKIFQVDPWNRLEDVRDRGEHETDYIGRSLRMAHEFVQERDMHGQIIAHPRVSMNYDRKKAPFLHDISGSKHWDNVPDQGFAVHRPKVWEDGVRQTDAELHHCKARLKQFGYPCIVLSNNVLFVLRMKRSKEPRRLIGNDMVNEPGGGKWQSDGVRIIMLMGILSSVRKCLTG
jgi:twinkle protein